ncbi:ThuA domain-containing protein, partial [bacterium]|nr:ThuA domain-containing protein [bacterium]
MNLRRMAIGALVACVLSAGLMAEAGQKSVLIYGKTFGFRHGGAIDKGNPILKSIAEGLGYKAVISEDPVVFDDMSKWDLIIFNNCTGGLNPKEEPRREALMKRIKAGAGFMGFHAATDCNYQWLEYGKMINGYFSGHPWNQEVKSKVEDADHPLMKAFDGGPFVIRDEIYQFRNYERSAVRILMSIDNSSVPVSRGARKDRDYAICWIRPWEKGRVYYNAHGHGENVFQDKIFQEHLKPAMQWAIGDIEVDTTPSKAIDTAALAAKAVTDLKAATTDKQRMAALGVFTWCPREDALPLVVAQFGTNQEVAAVAADAAQAILAKTENVAKAEKIAILRKALPLA